MFFQSIYPVNILRNIALYYVPTDFVFYCDVDFLPNPSAYDKMMKRIGTGVFPKHVVSYF